MKLILIVVIVRHSSLLKVQRHVAFVSSIAFKLSSEEQVEYLVVPTL